MLGQMAFLRIARSSCWESHRRGTRCGVNCDCLSAPVGVTGRSWQDHFPCCSARMVSRGEQESQVKTSQAFAKKNETAAHPREFLRSDRSLDTKHTCRPALTIRIIKSPMQMFGAMIRVRRITIATL